MFLSLDVVFHQLSSLTSSYDDIMCTPLCCTLLHPLLDIQRDYS